MKRRLYICTPTLYSLPLLSTLLRSCVIFLNYYRLAFFSVMQQLFFGSLTENWIGYWSMPNSQIIYLAVNSAMASGLPCFRTPVVAAKYPLGLKASLLSHCSTSMPLNFPPFRLGNNFAPTRTIALHGPAIFTVTIPRFLPYPTILPKPLTFQYQIPPSRVSFMKAQYLFDVY